MTHEQKKLGRPPALRIHDYFNCLGCGKSKDLSLLLKGWRSQAAQRHANKCKARVERLILREYDYNPKPRRR